MKKYTIELEEKEPTVSQGNGNISEVECALKIWQDLRKLNSSQGEDGFIENILEQILRIEFGEDIPKGYTGQKMELSGGSAEAVRQAAAAKISEIQGEG